MPNERSTKLLDDSLENLKISINNIVLSDIDKDQCDALRIPLQQVIIMLEDILYPAQSIKTERLENGK